MQSEELSQMTSKTKAVAGSSPVTDAGNSMVQSPTQEPASPGALAQPSTDIQQRTHQLPYPQRQYLLVEGAVPRFGRLSSRLNQDRREEHISGETREEQVQDSTSPQQINHDIPGTHSEMRSNPGNHKPHGQGRNERREAVLKIDRINRLNQGRKEEHISGETREAQAQDSTSPQQMKRDIPSTHSEGRSYSSNHKPRGQSHDERRDENETSQEIMVVEVQDSTSPPQMNTEMPSGRRYNSDHHNHHEQSHNEPRDANETSGEPMAVEVQDSTSSQQTKRNIRSTNTERRGSSGGYNRREQRHDERRDANETGGETMKMEVHDNTSPQQTNRNIRGRGSGRRGNSYHYRHNQRYSERRDANVREDRDDGGADEGERGGGEEEMKEAGGQEPASNSGLHSLNPSRLFHGRRDRESARDVIIRLERTIRKKEHDADLFSTRNEQLSEEIKVLKEEFARIQVERDRTSLLLQERTAELLSAQVFLGKADSVAVTDVSKMVDLLNAEISQASITIADSLSYSQLQADAKELNELLHREKSSIGTYLCEILAGRLCKPNAEFEPMITQIALQAGLSRACQRMINDWNPPFWDSSSTVNRIYTNMRLSEGQVIAGKWRALARTYANDQNSEDAKNEIREANADYMRSVLRDLLAIVGWSSRDPHQKLPSEYDEKMRFISYEALKLHETIWRGITSKDLIVDIIPCETPFDRNKMEDADRQRAEPGDIVGCTVELGLRYKVANPGRDSEETGIILKPKVLLASLLTGQDKEVAPSKARN